VLATAADGYAFDSFTCGLGGSGNPQPLTITSPVTICAAFVRTYREGVGTYPAVGLTFVVDGTSLSSQGSFAWKSGSTHAISVPTPQTGTDGVAYVFSSWSNGATTPTQQVTALASNDYIATFVPQRTRSAAKWPWPERVAGNRNNVERQQPEWVDYH